MPSAWYNLLSNLAGNAYKIVAMSEEPTARAARRLVGFVPGVLFANTDLLSYDIYEKFVSKPTIARVDPASDPLHSHTATPMTTTKPLVSSLSNAHIGE